MTAVPLLAWLAAAERFRHLARLAPVLVAALVFGLGCAIRLPGWAQLQRQEAARQAAVNEQYSANAAKQLELEQLQGALAVAERRLQEAQWHLAAGEGMSDMLDRLAASGQVHGLWVERLDVQAPEQQAGYRTTPLEVQVAGPYMALRQWLHDWLSQARLLRSGDMHLAAVEGQPGLLRLHLHIDAYQALAPVPAPEMLASIPARGAMPSPQVDLFAPTTSKMVGSGLAGVPLAQLQMVGSLSRGPVHEALLMAAGRVYRVQVGERLGRDHGVVQQIDQSRVEVRERLLMAGVWHERTAFITLAKRLGKEAPDWNENVDEMAAGSPAADAPGLGDALPG